MPNALPPDPYVAFLTALDQAHAAAGPRANAFRPGSQGIPGPSGVSSDASGAPGSVSGGVAGTGGGGSVPGTATTGPNLLADIIQGGGSPNDPIADDLVTRTLFQGSDRSDPSGISQGEFDNLQGGDIATLLGIVTGGIGAIPSIFGSLSASDALGLPPSTSLFDTLSVDEILALAGGEGGEPGDFGTLARGGEPFEFDPIGGAGGAGGLARPDPFRSNVDPFSAALASTAVDFGTPSLSFGGREESTADRGRDRERERTLSRERTTGRAAGPV